MSKLDVTIDDRDTLRMVEGMLKRIEAPQPLLKTVGRYMRKETLKMFRGRSPSTVTAKHIKRAWKTGKSLSTIAGKRGEIWPALAESTIKAKKAAVDRGDAIVANRPLVYSGKLMESLMSNSAIRYSRNGVSYGTDAKSKGYPYPAVHQTGTRDGKVPKRRFLFLNKDDLAQLANACKLHIENRLKEIKA